MTVKEFAAYVRKSPKTIRRKCQRGQLPAVKLIGSNDWRILVDRWQVRYNAAQYVPDSPEVTV